MIETLIGQVMQDMTEDVRFDPAVLAAAERSHRRRVAVRRSVVGAAVLGAAAVGAVIAVPGSAPATHHNGEVAAPATRDAAFIASHLRQALADEDGYLITSQVSGDDEGVTMTTWLDPASGDRRIALDNPDGSPNTAIGITVDGPTADLTTLTYANHSITHSTEPVSAVDDGERAGLNVPAPDVIRSQISASNLAKDGTAEVDGHQTFRLRLLSPIVANSAIWAKGVDVEFYVDTTTYQLIRVAVSDSGKPTYTQDLTWTPRASADLDQARLTVPAGFRR